MTRTARVYASHGVLAHEYETCWGIVPATEAYDEVTVALPDGYTFGENAAGEVMVEDEAGNVNLLVETLTRFADSPSLRFVADGTWRMVPLAIVED